MITVESFLFVGANVHGLIIKIGWFLEMQFCVYPICCKTMYDDSLLCYTFVGT